MANKPTPADFSPTVPDFPVIGQYQPVYGKFDLTTYVQGASDYEIMAFLVQCYNATLKGYSDVTQLSKDTVTAYNQLQTWVNTWFDNLDVQQEINNKLQAMYEAGTLANAIAQSGSIPPAVAQYLNSADGTKNLSDVTAQKIEAMAASGALGTVINNTGTVQSTTTNWLQQNVTPTGSAVVVDKSLSIEGAAADAKATGNIKKDIENLSNPNLFNSATHTAGYRLSITGVLAEGDKYFTSDYISVGLGLEYSKNSPVVNVYHRMCLYNSDKVFIKSIDDSNTFINTDASFVRFCGLLTELSTSVFRPTNARDAINRKELSELSDDYKELKKNIYDNIAYYKKSPDYTVYENHGWNANGHMTDSNVYNAIKMSVKEGKKIGFAGSFGASAVCVAKRFDGTLERINIDGDYSEDNLYLYTVGYGIVEIFLSVRNKNHSAYRYPFALYIKDIFECVDRIVSSNLNKHFYSIAHQGYTGYGAELNTLQAFVDAGRCGKFNGIETDARLTSDNIFVLNHNEYIEVSGTRYKIKEKTYAELKALKPDICTLEDCIKVCKEYGLFICIDKLIYSTIEENVMFLFPLIRKYQIFDDVIFTSAVSRVEWTQKILDFYKKAKIGFYYPNDWFNTEQLSKAKGWVNGVNEIFIFCANSALTVNNLELFYANCDGVKLGTSAGRDLELYKSLFYKTNYVDSDLYGAIDCINRLML
jgi:hypothetical protein